MQRYLAIAFFVLCLMLFPSRSNAQDIAYNFKMPVSYPDGSGWGINGGWGYMEYESGYDNYGNWFDNNVYHPGEDVNIDFGGNNDCGTEIRASANGIVTESDNYGTGWGNIIEIQSTLPDGSNVWLIYAHEKTRYVSTGDEVQQGDLIGLVGGGTLFQDNPGEVNDVYEYACHLHLEVRLQNMAADYWPEGQALSTLDEVKYTHPRNFILTHSQEVYDNPEDYLPVINDRAQATFQELNPYCGINLETPLEQKMLGSITEDVHWWFPDSGVPLDNGVARNTVLRNYSGGEKVGAILAHPDSNYAVQLYDKYWYTWAFTKDEREDDHNVYIDVVNDCNTDWFANGRGPLSNFGLPITGVYRLGSGNWRQDFQTGYMLWNADEQKLHLKCYDSVTPGWTTDGWQNVVSAGVARAYERNGARAMVGVPFSDGYGAELHPWSSLLIQNFQDGYDGGNSAIIVYSGHTGQSINRASLVRDAFWAYYASNDGANQFGAPLGDEMDTHKRNGAYTGYDPACDFDDDGWNTKGERRECVVYYCCGEAGCNPFEERYTSMQRFEKATLCYDRRWANEVMCDPSTANSYCVTAVANVPASDYGMGGGGGEVPSSEPEGDDDSTPSEPDEPLTECDLHTGGYMRLDGDFTSWWQDMLPNGGYVDLNDCVLDYQWVGVSVGGLHNEAACFEFFDRLESVVDVQQLLWWHYTNGTIWHNIDVMTGPSYQTGYCNGQVAPNMPIDPPSSGDDDDATESGDDDDYTTPEPEPEPLTTINCVPNWDTAAGVWGGEWKLCWAYPWNPALNTWDATGGLNDQIQYDWSVWFTFGAASQGDANLIADEFENMVANGTVVFANVNTGAITLWVHADSVTPTSSGGGYQWMLSPSVGNTLIGPSPVTSVNW